MKSISGLTMALIAVVLMVAVIVFGKHMQPDMTRLGLAAYLEQHGAMGQLHLLSFGLGVPIAWLLFASGALRRQGRSWADIVRIGLALIALSLLVVIVPHWLGTKSQPLFFGLGGIILLVLVSAWFWYWALDANTSRVTPWFLRGLGYFCFALATWNLCGFGGMPAFALRPDHLQQSGALDFAAGQLKSIMVYLVLGWGLTVAATVIDRAQKNTGP